MENIDENFMTIMRNIAASMRTKLKGAAANAPRAAAGAAKGGAKLGTQTAAYAALSNMLSNPNDPNNPKQKKKTQIDDYKPTSVKAGDSRIEEPDSIKKLRGATVREMVEARVQFATDKQAKDFHSHIEGSGLATGTREGSSVEYDSSDTRKYVKNAIRRKMKELKGKVADVK